MSLYLAAERRQHFNIPHISDKISKTRKTLRPRPRLESGCRNNRGAGKEKKEALNQTDSTESDEPGECLHYILFDCENYIYLVQNRKLDKFSKNIAPGPQSS